jgi:hypothetical protein
LDEIPDTKISLLQKLDGLPSSSYSSLDGDIGNVSTLKAEFAANENLLEAWEVLYISNVSGEINWLEQIQGWLDLGVTSSKTQNTINFLTPNGIEFAKIENDLLIFSYSGFGGDIAVNPNKVTTVLGKFREDFSDPNSFGTWVFLQKNGGLPDGVISRVVNITPPTNSIAFLDLPEAQYNALLNSHIRNEIETSPLFDGNMNNLALITNQNPWSNDIVNLIQSDILPSASLSEINSLVDIGRNNGNTAFWNTYNLPFLEAAFQRGDNIRLVSNNALGSPTRSGSYQLELEEIEDVLMQQYGYQFNSTTKTYEKQ